MFTSSVKMAFSTNFISASCVKLNKFNFIIFLKKLKKKRNFSYYNEKNRMQNHV